MTDKINQIILSGKEISKKLFNPEKVEVLSISRRVDNFGSFKGWLIEYKSGGSE